MKNGAVYTGMSISLKSAQLKSGEQINSRGKQKPKREGSVLKKLFSEAECKAYLDREREALPEELRLAIRGKKTK